jgi:hypothetical protein
MADQIIPRPTVGEATSKRSYIRRQPSAEMLANTAIRKAIRSARRTLQGRAPRNGKSKA